MKELILIALVSVFTFYGVYHFVKSTFKNIILFVVKLKEGKEKID